MKTTVEGLFNQVTQERKQSQKSNGDLYLLGFWMLAITNKNLMIRLVVNKHCIDGQRVRFNSVLQISNMLLLAAVKLTGIFPF